MRRLSPSLGDVVAEPPAPPTETLCGRAVPRVILGTAKLGSVLPGALVSGAERERSFQHLDRVLEAGCTAFDLAASYLLGGTERLFGDWLTSRRNRDRLFLVTKGGHPYPLVQPHRLTPEAIGADLHASLRRLRTERVELYLLHRDDPSAPLESILETLVAHQRAGKIGAFGVSNWSHPRLRALDELARSAGLPTVAASSPQLSLVEWTSPPWQGSVSISGEAHRDARAFYAERKLPVLAWSPLGRGFLTGESGGKGHYGGPSNEARKRRAEALARRYSVTPTQIALAYLFSQPFPVFAVVAASTVEKVRQNLAASTQRLSDADVSWLESGGPPVDA
jgi:aryl-alcohol dehydrogenase-like predicted oxidoreductase